jgi:hypothetical protein
LPVEESQQWIQAATITSHILRIFHYWSLPGSDKNQRACIEQPTHIEVRNSSESGSDGIPGF